MITPHTNNAAPGDDYSFPFKAEIALLIAWLLPKFWIGIDKYMVV
jgi:hypothetical protein